MAKRASNPASGSVDRCVGDSIRSRRLALGMNEGDLDKAIDEPRGSVAKFERAAKVVGAHQLYNLSRALGVPPSFFFQELENTVPSADVPGPTVVEEARQFLRLYHAIRDMELRRSLYDLVKSVAEDPVMGTVNLSVLAGDDLPATIDTALDGTGMISRGGFHPGADDGLPADTGTVVLIGNAGGAMWEPFSRQKRDEPHPMDGWARRVLTETAGKLDARVLFPFDGPPYYPFQRWAQRAEPVFPSPIGALVHPEFGLWHAYRGAFLFSEKLDWPEPPPLPSPCDSCPDKPCTTTCPVGAVSENGYDVPACVEHLKSDEGEDCMGHTCLARYACPVGDDYPYRPEQARFHMEKFLQARRTPKER